MKLPEVPPLAITKSELKAEMLHELHRPLPTPPNPAQFQQNVEVVRLAIELARLRGHAKPKEHLAEAAMLITEAGVALEMEKDRPEQEMAETVGALASNLVRCDRVPADIILKPGKREGGNGSPTETHTIQSEDCPFSWRPYSSERGFCQLLEKHYTAIFAAAAKDLRPMLCQDKPDIVAAENYLRTKGYSFDSDVSERLREVKDFRSGNQFLAAWQAGAVSKTVEGVLARTKEGWLNTATLRALAETRNQLNVSRAQKARKRRTRTK